MKKTFSIFAVLLLWNLHCFAQQQLNIYKDEVVINQFSTEEIDSISVTETEPRIISMWHNGEVFLTYTSDEIDSITVANTGGRPYSYIGIVGFNNQLYTKDIGILSRNTSNAYMSFVNNLPRKDGTLLYYAVDNALDMLDNANITTPIKSVNFITFTDGLDQGSLMMTDKYGSSVDYLNALSNRMAQTKIKNLPINAYSVGLRGNDVNNEALFNQNLLKLASSAEQTFEISSIDDLNDKLKDIANQIISVNTRQTLSVRIPGVDNGTLVRFVFDEEPAGNSNLYIEGTFNLKDRSLHNVTYHGMKATSGGMVQGTQDGIFVTYTFTGLHTESGDGIIPTYSIRHYYKTPSATSWQINSEFSPASNTQRSVSRFGTTIMLALDCSSSLGSDFSTMQQYANNFIDIVANNAVPYVPHVSSPSITVNLDEMGTRGYLSEESGWEAFKNNINGVADRYDVRVTLMLYQAYNSAPIAIAPTQYIKKGDLATTTNKIEFAPLSVPLNSSITAIAFVDFVGKDHADKFYDVSNLRTVKPLYEDVVMNSMTDTEMWDCYHGKISFYTNWDVTNDNTAVDTNVPTLNIQVVRYAGKVRVVMTDYSTYGQWKQYFAGEDPSRIFNAMAMKVKYMATEYDALSGGRASNTYKDVVFVSEYNYQNPTISWVRPLDKETMRPTTLEYANMRGFCFTDAEMAELDDNTVAYPVISFNYLIPADDTDAAVYNMEFAALSKQGEGEFVWDGNSDWKKLQVRHINYVPVVKNTLTTIWGNFLTAETPSFLVTINDVFDNEIDRVLLYDESRTYTVFTIAGVKVEIERDADGKIINCYVDRNEDKITAENYNELVKGLQDLKIWVDETFYLDNEPWANFSNLYIFFNGYLKDNDDILKGHKIGAIHFVAEGSLFQPYTNNDFTDDLYIYSNEYDQPDITITNKDLIHVEGGTDKFHNLDLTSEESVQIVNANVQNVKSKSPSENGTTIQNSTVYGNFNVEGDATIISTTIEGEINVTGTITYK